MKDTGDGSGLEEPTRRHFLMLTGGTLVAFSLEGCDSALRRAWYRVEDRFSSPPTPLSESERGIAELPREGEFVSVERALDSRCSSDDDGNPHKFHWGMFDGTRKLSEDQRRAMLSRIVAPRFTAHRVETTLEAGVLAFAVASDVTGIERDWVMIESGMQQQAAGLVAAALGIGAVFQSLGPAGVTLPDGKRIVIRMRLDAMKPTYGASYWTDAPLPRSLRRARGNLPAPMRDGKHPFLSVLREAGTFSETGHPGTDRSLGQLLWAARGRTPHHYKGRPWGMTIPASMGRQDRSGVYAIQEQQVAVYVNRAWNGPAHALRPLQTVPRSAVAGLAALRGPYGACLVFAVHEDSDIALWEIGYQLLNAILQARALEIGYRALLLDSDQRRQMSAAGIRGAAAALLFRQEDRGT